jgi:hypothetical protein
MAGCGSGSITAPPPPSKTTPLVTVTPSAQSITTAQGLTVTISVAGSPAPTGSVTLSSGSYTSAAATLTNGSASINISAGALAAGTDALSASYSGDSNYNSASGSASVTVVKMTPAVTVTPGLGTIDSAQALAVTVAVSGGSGAPAPTGSVALSSGSYASASATLSSGGATINIPAGSLAVGSDTLTVAYTPDANGSATYNSASGTGSVTVTSASTYGLTIDSAGPSSGITIGVSPNDNGGQGAGATPFTRTYNSGAQVTLSAALAASGYSFVSWTGCTSNPVASNCLVTMSANATVTATYNAPQVLSITVTPNTAVVIGNQQQFTATVNGTGAYSKSVTWSISAPSGSTLSPGDIGSAGLYNTPFPAPATVTVKATSVSTPSVSGSVTVPLNQAPGASGPALSVDAGDPTHAISPDIYGMNAYTLNQSAAKAVNLPVDRWGGDSTSRYNYQLDVTNLASDWYFEDSTQATGQQATSAFNAQVTSDQAIGAKTLGTVPVLGWVAKNGTSCSFPSSTYPSQVGFDPYNARCGNGLYPSGVSGCTSSSGCNITGNNATLTDQPVGPSWAGGWVAYLVSKFGTAANGGVAIYDLDNEPAWWDAVHRDVHPAPSTYDEVTNNGIATAQAIKAADSTAAVSGPVVDYWWNYFYSKKDIENGWSTGPCYQPWSGPTDRAAHGGVPFIEYYLQQFKSASTTYGARLLDYLDLHTYFAAVYNGSSVGLTTAGDTQEQQVRLNSTRVLWDPTYTDPNDPQPNYSANPSSLSCTVPLQAPQLIPMAQNWVSTDYPGTKVAFTEYNWGGQENINGAVAQADILGIFGKYGLDLATLWGPPDPAAQVPGLMAFEIYRNYDGKNSMFGDTALNSTSANQGQLSVYGAVRASDHALTVMVINKTYGPLTSTLSLANFTSSSSTAQVYLYSSINLSAIVPQTATAITAPAGSGATSTINYTFPAQSITLLVIPSP